MLARVSTNIWAQFFQFYWVAFVFVVFGQTTLCADDQVSTGNKAHSNEFAEIQARTVEMRKCGAVRSVTTSETEQAIEFWNRMSFLYQNNKVIITQIHRLSIQTSELKSINFLSKDSRTVEDLLPILSVFPEGRVWLKIFLPLYLEKVVRVEHREWNGKLSLRERLKRSQEDVDKKTETDPVADYSSNVIRLDFGLPLMHTLPIFVHEGTHAVFDRYVRPRHVHTSKREKISFNVIVPKLAIPDPTRIVKSEHAAYRIEQQMREALKRFYCDYDIASGVTFSDVGLSGNSYPRSMESFKNHLLRAYEIPGPSVERYATSHVWEEYSLDNEFWIIPRDQK